MCRQLNTLTSGLVLYDTWLCHAPSPAIWEPGDNFPPLELLPVPGDKASPVKGSVGAGSGEDGGEGCAGTGSQPVSQGCARALSVNHWGW